MMRNPRRIVLTDEMIKKFNLSTDPPPPDSLFWQMWDASKAIANQALATAYIQGIGGGTLDPTYYGAFNVLDSYYCFNGAQSYLAAESRTQEPGLQAFLMAKYKSYEAYNASFTQTWHVRNAEGVVPNTVCKLYSQYEADICSHADPIYCIVVMLPCEYLWYWLASQLYPPKEGNLYAEWITGNDDPGGAYAMGNFLDAYMKAHPGVVNTDTAITIYKTATEFEYQNFAAATPS